MSVVEHGVAVIRRARSAVILWWVSGDDCGVGGKRGEEGARRTGDGEITELVSGLVLAAEGWGVCRV